MKPLTPEAIYQTKAERRKRLAALPMEEKVRLIEKLRQMGQAMREARVASKAHSAIKAGKVLGRSPRQ